MDRIFQEPGGIGQFLSDIGRDKRDQRQFDEEGEQQQHRSQGGKKRKKDPGTHRFQKMSSRHRIRHCGAMG